MDRQYQDLPIRELGPGAGFRSPQQPQPARVTLESPAVEVMTDLARVSPATIRPQAPLEGANQFMISRGVRLLLVVDVLDVVLGVLTATDVLGEKALRVAAERGIRRGRVRGGLRAAAPGRLEGLDELGGRGDGLAEALDLV